MNLFNDITVYLSLQRLDLNTQIELNHFNLIHCSDHSQALNPNRSTQSQAFLQKTTRPFP